MISSSSIFFDWVMQPMVFFCFSVLKKSKDNCTNWQVLHEANFSTEWILPQSKCTYSVSFCHISIIKKKQFATPRVLPPSHSQLYAQVRSSKWGLCQFRSDISEIWGSQCCVGIESPGIMGWPRIIVMISTAGCKCFKQLLHSLPLQAFSLAPGACDPSVDYHSVCTYTSIYVNWC